MPSVRPDSLTKFMQAWEPLFEQHEVSLIVVEDTDDPWDLLYTQYESRLVSHKDIPDWVPRGTDMIRSWGIYLAWLEASEYTLTLDDDVRPLDGVDILAEYEKAFETPAFFSDYLSVGDLTTAGFALRGFPYRDRKIAIPAIQYGGWHGVLDFDAPTQLLADPSRVRGHKFAPVCIPVPKFTPVTTCIMNAAWRTEFAPLMWQLPMHGPLYNRFGDIWSGLLQKKMLDAFGHAMLINGCASVYHERASDPITNLEREAPGIRVNETLWEHLSEFDLYEPALGDSIGDAYRSLITTFAKHPDLDPDYAAHLKEASDCWLALFDW